MNNIFVLEDAQHRIDIFNEYLEYIYPELPRIITICEDYKSAVKCYNSSHNVIFLDHDLGGKAGVSSEDDNTGYQFVKYLKEYDMNLQDKEIIIHSMNPTGAMNMHRLIPYAKIIPFKQLVNIFKELQIERK